MPAIMTIRLLHSQLEGAARRRGKGWLEAIRSAGNSQVGYFEIDSDKLKEINATWPVSIAFQEPVEISTRIPQPKPQRQESKPAGVWPANIFGVVARALKLMRTPEDKGVGDTIARVVGPIGGDAYKVWFMDTFGRSCGCTERQDSLNERFPYEKAAV